MARPIKFKNEIIETGDFLVLKIYSLKEGKWFSSFFDKSDIGKIMDHHWNISSNGYVTTNTISKNALTIHREIMRHPKEKVVDHINGNKLDNRSENLRIVTQSENIQKANRKGRDYKGVFKRGGSYFVSIQYDGKAKYVTGSQDLTQAKIIYDINALKVFGGKCHLNLAINRDAYKRGCFDCVEDLTLIRRLRNYS